jgi:radical SAM protein with 4Fe4S-binding SPASM domain
VHNVPTTRAKVSFPQWITLQLIDACNLRCKMCYEWGENGSYHGRKSTLLKLEVVKKLIADCAPARPYYALFGGEPMAYPWLADVVAAIRSTGSRVDMPTNGMFLAKKAEMLCEAPLNRIWVSLDGPREVNDEQRGLGVFDAVQNGVQVLYDLRERRGQTEPKIGYTFIVTPGTHKYIQTFAEECIDFQKIDHLSIEFQTFIPEETYLRHRDFFRKTFGVQDTPCAKGLVAKLEDFSRMDYGEIARQIRWVRRKCEEHGVYFVCYPKTVDPDNYRAYFEKRIEDLIDRRDRCMFPWIYLEVASNGDATPCHTFYDYPIGNINEIPVLDIWRGERLGNMRNALRTHGLFPACSACARYYADPSKH